MLPLREVFGERRHIEGLAQGITEGWCSVMVATSHVTPREKLVKLGGKGGICSEVFGPGGEALKL